MAKTICKFKATGWTRDHWSGKRCYEDINTIFNEVKSYIGLSREFDFRSYYGDVRPCKVTITNVEQDEYGAIIFTEEADIDMPKHYMPGPSEIIKPSFIEDPDYWRTRTEAESAAYAAQYTFISPKSYSRI